MKSPNILLARQPIYDARLNVTAYELLFRPPQEEEWEWDGDVATSRLVLNAFTEIGIDKAADNKQAFINFTRAWLLSPPPFDSRFVGIEILESVEPDREVVTAARELSRLGFTIALDDFIFDPKWHEMLHIADIVKVDVLQHTSEQLEQLTRKLDQYPVKLLAEKVENYNMFDQCRSLGFDYFQGYFLCKPQNIHGDTTSSNKIVVMRLLAQLQDPDVEIEGLEKIISNDISLSTKLLRICNSVHYATRVKIESLRKAMVVVGLQTLKQWSAIIALSRLSDKPSELITLTLTRARTMELLARTSDTLSTDMFFTVGMFSCIDAFFDQAKQTILQSLPFSDEVNQALLHYEGTAGKVLRAVEAHEKGHWSEINWPELEALGISQTAFREAYLNALPWTAGIMQSLRE